MTALAALGTKRKPVVDIGDRDPKEFALSTRAQGCIARAADVAREADVRAVVRGAFPREVPAMVRNARDVSAWLARLIKEARR